MSVDDKGEELLEAVRGFIYSSFGVRVNGLLWVLLLVSEIAFQIAFAV